MIGYISVSVIENGQLVIDRICPPDEPIRETIGELLAGAAVSGHDTEVWILLHDHAFDEDDVCDCDMYLGGRIGPYMVLNRHPEQINP